jgi:thiosulfate/3-mercaptopyruvate sulfurtransferase
VIGPIVDARWLGEHRDAVVLADVRWYLDGRSGREAYVRGHLPGAVFVDLDRWLAAPASPEAGRHPLPAPEVFAEGMAASGIGDEDTVIAYDDAGGVTAARLVWMLRVIGRPAALLDGGIDAYDGPLEPGSGTIRPAVFHARPWPPERLASIEDVASGSALLLDARDRNRFLGEFEPVDPRAGHIPGARNVPVREHLDERKRLLAVEELRRRFAAAGVEEAADVVSYCGSGVTACHNLLVLEHAGLGRGRLYPGSFSQWSHTDRPVATGD